jgi:hypothetical protein
MVGFLILLFVMMSLWVMFLGMSDFSEIAKNWDKHRCQPTVMPFASFFGHDTSENFTFCLQGIIKGDAGGMLSPIFQILGICLGTLGQLMTVANSIRLEFATMMGGINTFFQNFIDRVMQLGDKIKQTVMRTRMLMGRVYATFFALIYISISGTTALQNFGDTTLFKFLDIFCFDPDTLVVIKGKGSMPVKDVRIGDVFEATDSRVTSTFSFESDGQPMVEFPGGITVSTNHYMRHDGKFIRAEEHPDAKPTSDWAGGNTRPLICFNTSDHIIPINEYRFLDYDEMDAGDEQTMAWIEKHLNADMNKPKKHTFDYSTVFQPDIMISMKDKSTKKACDIQLGQETSQGRVIGIVKKEVKEACILPTREYVSPGLLLWDYMTNRWRRAGDTYSTVYLQTPEIYYNFVVKGTASVEFASKRVVRDYVEIHSPESEQFYAKAIESALPTPTV